MICLAHMESIFAPVHQSRATVAIKAALCPEKKKKGDREPERGKTAVAMTLLIPKWRRKKRETIFHSNFSFGESAGGGTTS